MQSALAERNNPLITPLSEQEGITKSHLVTLLHHNIKFNRITANNPIMANTNLIHIHIRVSNHPKVIILLLILLVTIKIPAHQGIPVNPLKKTIPNIEVTKKPRVIRIQTQRVELVVTIIKKLLLPRPTDILPQN